MKTWEDEEDGYPEIEKTKKGGGGGMLLPLAHGKEGENKKSLYRQESRGRGEEVLYRLLNALSASNASSGKCRRLENEID